MSFQSLAYFLFLTLAWTTARITPPAVLRQAVLLAFSYAFYWSWSPGFLLLLTAASGVNFLWGEAIRRRPVAGVLSAAVFSNLLLLSFFKYLPEILPGLTADLTMGGVAVPLGISFYTFQAISYLVDVYRGAEQRPTLLEFALYLAFWPIILSGPICRLPEMLPQFRSSSLPGLEDLGEGVRRIILGLFLKVVLADTLALGLESQRGLLQAWREFAGGHALDVGVLCLGYGFQIFFDFAGYSHIAIGSARLFGIRVRENFDAPFMASTISDFWKRWHMSLSSWVRDYVFFPLAVRRSDLPWRSFSLVVSMVTFGVWHGPRLTFVLWGLYHGLLLAAHRLIQQWRRQRTGRRPPGSWGGAGSWGGTFLAVTAGWILFASEGLGQSWVLARSLLDFSSARQLEPELVRMVVTVAILYFSVEIARRRLAAALGPSGWERLLWYARPVYLATMLLLVVIWSDRSSPFVYVRF